jgi:hypothetical protein
MFLNGSFAVSFNLILKLCQLTITVIHYICHPTWILPILLNPIEDLLINEACLSRQGLDIVIPTFSHALAYDNMLPSPESYLTYVTRLGFLRAKITLLFTYMNVFSPNALMPFTYSSP